MLPMLGKHNLKGRPRSSAADRAILEAFREVLSEKGFADLRLEHVAARGDLRDDADPERATELLVGPVYFRVFFGGELTNDFAEAIVDAYVAAFGTPSIARAGRARVVSGTTTDR